jgi:hypothetical protein
MIEVEHHGVNAIHLKGSGIDSRNSRIFLSPKGWHVELNTNDSYPLMRVENITRDKILTTLVEMLERVGNEEVIRTKEINHYLNLIEEWGKKGMLTPVPTPPDDTVEEELPTIAELDMPQYRDLHQKVVTILMDRGESFLADDGVDKAVCNEVADEILATLPHCSLGHLDDWGDCGYYVHLEYKQERADAPGTYKGGWACEVMESASSRFPRAYVVGYGLTPHDAIMECNREFNKPEEAGKMAEPVPTTRVLAVDIFRAITPTLGGGGITRDMYNHLRQVAWYYLTDEEKKICGGERNET